LENYYHNHRLSAEDATTVRLSENGLAYDFSKSLISTEAFSMLLELAEECQLPQAINDFFSGEAINETENRAVLHTALRQFTPNDYLPEEVYAKVDNERNRVKKFVEEVLSGERLASNGKPFRHVVNIGIGGSDLGLRMAYRALQPYK